ncbi:MAG: helix-turn-helix domain-containing protein [Bacteroidota bacterium]
MTEKQARILIVALQLFAKEGYRGTSTRQVAQKAEVSEGLIFRHFGNKEGLLHAILKEGEERAQKFMAKIVLETDPQKIIEKMLEFPFEVAKYEKEYWKLIYMLKWQMAEKTAHSKGPLMRTLIHAFSELGYEQPEQEALLILVYLDGIAHLLLTDEEHDLEGLLPLLKQKYNIA